MSMSQEEIEALMSGAGEIAPKEEEPQEEISEEEIDATEEDDAEVEIPFEESNDEELSEEDPLAESEDEEQEVETPSTDEEEPQEDASDENLDNLDDILAGIDGIVDDVDTEPEKEESSSKEVSHNDDLESLIEQNQYPMPAKAENKVVNQLNQVADDSEEKASQIFDVLSFILDENNEIQNYNKNMGQFIEEQIKLLESLSVKFPNISVFNQNLEKANELLESSKDLDAKVNAENNKIFEAMELMQYHDINRQKIERVMSVIKKLNNYLNGIFEDDSERPDVQIAKHISGDSSETVDAEDIESLISEFSN